MNPTIVSRLSLAAALALGTAVAAGLAGPASAQTDDAPAASDAPHRHGGMRHRGMPQEWRDASPQERAVLGDLRRLEHLYVIDGRGADLAALYQDVLAKTQNATVQAAVQARLERLQSRPADAAARIQTLTERLNQDLGQL